MASFVLSSVSSTLTKVGSLISGNPFSLLALICAVLLSLQSEGFIQPRKEHVTEEDHELEAENSVPKKGKSLIKYAWWRQEVLTGEIILISTPKLTASPWIFFPFFFFLFFFFFFKSKGFHYNRTAFVWRQMEDSFSCSDSFFFRALTACLFSPDKQKGLYKRQTEGGSRQKTHKERQEEDQVEKGQEVEMRSRPWRCTWWRVRQCSNHTVITCAPKIHNFIIFVCCFRYSFHPYGQTRSNLQYLFLESTSVVNWNGLLWSAGHNTELRCPIYYFLAASSPFPAAPRGVPRFWRWEGAEERLGRDKVDIDAVMWLQLPECFAAC